jgi:hypothetical protein
VNPDAGRFLAAQLAAAVVVLLGLPFGLLLLASRRAWLDRAAAAVDRARTATLLAGAGTFLVAVALGVVAARFRALQFLAPVLVVALAALFATGFTVGAWAQGRALVARGGGTSCLVWGWLARAGAFAVPLLGVLLGAYLVALSLGTPLVAWLTARNATTEPSDGSTPAS